VTGPDELLASPLACAFFLLAAREQLPVEEASRPAMADALVAEVAIELNPWTSYAVAARAEVLARAPEVRSLAGAVLADPASAWWWAPLGRRQVAVGGPADPTHVPAIASSPWAEYGQRPYPRLVTSTPYEWGDGWQSGMHAALAAQTGDLDPDYPLWQVELTVAPAARVFEVRSADDWRALALAHPVRKAPTGVNPDPDGLASDVAPDWVSVARQWDGVHLGFGGLLAASLRPLGAAGDRTVLWTWECEQTVWVRDAFAGRAPLPPLTAAPPLHYDTGPFELVAAGHQSESVGYLRPVEPAAGAVPGLAPPEARHRRPRRPRRPRRRWFRR
jgi:hypothetical protein